MKKLKYWISSGTQARQSATLRNAQKYARLFLKNPNTEKVTIYYTKDEGNFKIVQVINNPYFEKESQKP